MKTLILVDGHNLLFRMFYGMREAVIGVDGKSVHGAAGFIGGICSIINALHPTHMVVLFDSEECGDRRQINPEYKANRPDYSKMTEEECPFTQLPYIYRCLSVMGVAYSEVHGCEADDMIAAYALKYTGAADMMVGIVSTDKDYYQLISDNVWVINCGRGRVDYVTPDTVRAKYNIPPSLFADFKCLIGDKSDNITGAVGIGPKYAAELLVRFGSLDAIIERRAEIERPSHRRSIEEAAHRLLENRRLILLDGHADLPFTIDEAALPRLRWVSPSRVLADAGVL
ncbi:MAG: 5'-3' exonuclease [Ruminococcaceae bacterium]|nr:5'-3' exonuclease [Oscillospiraceae bacterium]